MEAVGIIISVFISGGTAAVIAWQIFTRKKQINERINL